MTDQTQYDTSFSGSDTWRYDPHYLQMTEFLGVKDEDRHDDNLAKKISFIRDFTGEKDETEAKVKIKQMIRELGISSQGKEMINQLYQYARLAQDKQRIEKEMSLFKREGSENNEPPSNETKEEIVKSLNPEDVKLRVKEKMGEVTKTIKSNVKREITSSINKGIQEAISNIMK